MQKGKRYFNTSGPNIVEQHYTLMRPQLVAEGMEAVQGSRYFTIWAPRQTGKSTYFQLLSKELLANGYQVAAINVEDLFRVEEPMFAGHLADEIHRQAGLDMRASSIAEWRIKISQIKEGKVVLIIDEVEGLAPDLFGLFLHSIRNLYHSRQEHCLKSVILVGVSNIFGIVEDHASPFNIADNLEIPYFSKEESYELLHQHETETGQLFEEKVKAKISEMTANQPGLVNGFAFQLVKRNPEKSVIDFEDYLRVEDWYITEAIDKNVSNVLKHARKHRPFVEQLLYTEDQVSFRIHRAEIKALHTVGLIQKDTRGNVIFWVPLYKKVLYDAFYPEINGERGHFFSQVGDFSELIKGRKIDFDFLIQNYKDYVKRRSFKAFREKDPETNMYLSIKEAALMYSFETYISFFLQHLDAKSYVETGVGLGRSDILINYQGLEYVIETKIYRYPLQVQQGLKQLSYYCRSLGIEEGLYLIFASNTSSVKGIAEGIQDIEGVRLMIYIVEYDEEKDF